MKNFTFIFCTVLFFTNCTKSNLSNKSPIKEIWKSVLHGEHSIGTTIEPKIIEEGVLFSSDPLNGDYNGYWYFNRDNGNILWHWKDNINEIESHQGDNIAAYKDGKIVLNNGNKRYCIDKSTGKTIWKIKDQFSYGYLYNQLDEYIYTVRLSPNDGWIVRYMFDNPDAQILYECTSDSFNLREAPYPPAIIQEGNRTLIVFSDGFVNYNDGKGHPWLTCYDLTNKLLVWRNQISNSWFNAGIWDIPLIHNNRIYVTESFHVVCLDLFTGEEIWRRTENGAFFTGGILMAEGKLFAMCENLTLYTINPEDGSLIHAEKNNGSGTRMHYHKGRIYYVGQGDGLLHCIDASSGKHLWTMEGPEYQKNDDLFFDNAGLAIDPETDMLYITDYRYAYGYKILE